MPKMRFIKITTDVLLALLLLATLAYPWTGRHIHTWVVYAWAFVVLLHAVWNRGWYASLWRGSYSPRRILTVVLALLLWAAVGALASGVVLAHFRHAVGSALWWRQLHIGSAYWLLVLCGLHAGLHLETWAAPLRQKAFFNKIKKILALAAWAAAAGGLWACWRLHIGRVLWFSASFSADGGTWYYLALQTAGVFWLCAFAAHILTRRVLCK